MIFVPFFGQRSAISDFITTTPVLLVGMSLFQVKITRDDFMFILNNKMFAASIVKTVLLSPAVGEQLQVDTCARRFNICIL
jgi:hypothetical protein